MEGHIWPSLYPAIIVGLIIGLGHGSIANVIAGGLGGLIGGAGGFFILDALGLNNGLIGSVGTILSAAVLALLCIMAVKSCLRRCKQTPDQASQ